ncbi:hypothetical protein Acsp03_55050 [Actinomadura sp. NBRC 104412]|nr:hypothetical protein Acsp03_55050 [Actinomadura sp. NBRC 104412]
MESCIAALASDPRTGPALMARLERGVTVAWERGWQPADLVRYVARRLASPHQRLAVDAIASEMRAYPPSTVDDHWRSQLAAIGAKVWWQGPYPLDGPRHGERTEAARLIICALELLELLLALPRLVPIGPRPGTANAADAAHARTGAGTGVRALGRPPLGQVDERMLGKVRALLAKAESTEFPEEAEALSARAQELMARHSIDHALLDAESGTGSEPAGRRIPVENPYDGPKAALLTVVADANRCRAVWHRELGFSTVLGFPADLTAVEMLFTSLLVQGTTAMVHAGTRRDAAGRSRTRSFRHAFLNAYAARIGERLREAADRAAADTAGRDALLPVLAARDQAVDDAVAAMFPNLVQGRTRSVTNHEGWAAGRAAADMASLSARSEVAGRQGPP